MKTRFGKLAGSLAAVALLMAPQAFAKVVDLSGFKGSYKGTVIVNGGGQAFSGTANVVIKPSKRGDKAAITFLGMVSVSGSLIPFQTTISLAKKKAMSTTDTLVGLGFSTKAPGAGTYRASKKSFNFSASAFLDPSIVLSGVGKVRDAGKKRKLHLLLTLTVGGSAFTFTSDVTAKVPKSVD